jgi:hypothetical protein
MRFLIDEDDDFEPELSRVALLLDPAEGASALDVVVLTGQQVNGAGDPSNSFLVLLLLSVQSMAGSAG